jgi:hypothetical protein
MVSPRQSSSVHVADDCVVNVDLFAFIIKMPTIHRLSVFRDDIVFIIYLYQRWIYSIDSSRPIEK